MRTTPAEIETQLIAALDQLAPELGDRLPPERALARKLGCSRETLRRALARLERAGELWRHVGQGTFRGPRPRSLPLRDTLLIEGATPQDLLSARLILEPQIAAAAADRAGPDDIAALRAAVANGRKARDRAACEAADDAFHRAVAQVSDNAVLIGVLRFFSGARRRAAWQRDWDRTYRRIGASEFRTLHSDQHEAIVDAIANRNAFAARSAMSAHLQTIVAAMKGGKNSK